MWEKCRIKRREGRKRYINAFLSTNDKYAILVELRTLEKKRDRMSGERMERLVRLEDWRNGDNG